MKDQNHTRSLANAYLQEARYECLRMMRSPTFACLALLLPLLMYLFMGVYLDGTLSHASTSRIVAVFGHWTTFSVIWPGTFGFGASVAIERDQGLLALKRAMPVPISVYLFGKASMSVAFGFLAALLIALASMIATKSGLTSFQYVEAIAVATGGALLFASIGLFVGSRAPAQHVTGIMYFVYIPIMLLAGLFFPVPTAIKNLSPAYYLDQLLARSLGSPAIVSAPLAIAVMVAISVLMTVLSVRRLAGDSTPVVG